ncbi:MAG: hypothetical protein RIC55_03715 [Pirellulaceae bacterium]
MAVHRLTQHHEQAGSAAPVSSADALWARTQIIEAWAGETRLNLIRLVGVLVFYGQHLVHYLFFNADEHLSAAYHTQTTALVMAWMAAVVALFVCLARRLSPRWLKYAVTALDAALIAALLIVSGGPRSAFLPLFLLVVAAAPLRPSLGLVTAATSMAAAGYLFVLGYYVLVQVGVDDYYQGGAAVRIPRDSQILFLLTLAVAGLLAGQAVRQMRRSIARAALLVDGEPTTNLGRDAETEGAA